VGGGIPAGTRELNTQGLPLIIHSVASDTTPVAISHADMGHDHPPASFDVWRLQPMGGSWTITGRAQPGRSCRGVTGGADEPDPVTLTVVGSCSGELGTGPQSIIPPEPVSPSDAGSSLLKCNGDIAGSGSRIVHLWIQQPTGCVVQESFIADSVEQAVECARAESKEVAGEVTELHPGPSNFQVSCGRPSSCVTFMAFNRGDAFTCAESLCPGSGSTFTAGHCSP